MLFRGCLYLWIVAQDRDEEMREEKGRKEHSKANMPQCSTYKKKHASMLKTLNILINQLHLFFEYTKYKYIFKDSFLYYEY